ncbi:SAVED domain-containing protein [Alicyclobacillus mengziensis]|uniref:SAVED domain-containing protein n=1 Tax=Alicyclobacillus mengziensis TaxID=2931921 RepID=A0A9X7W0J6_9BACL|nr:SAVED domain-containing protein [Alicyclobacillus mengziensis]QSO48414.1 SAVED domain-containing protein [Alicyclobacillus mengziensis]
MLILMSCILVLALVITGYFVVNGFRKKKKEQGFAKSMISMGFGLIPTSFGGDWGDKLFALASGFILKTPSSEVLQQIDQTSQLNLAQLVVGIVLLGLGIFFDIHVRRKYYILNIDMIGRRIDNYENSAGLSHFDYKEYVIDIKRECQGVMTSETAKDIHQIIEENMKAFRERTAQLKRGYTGVSPIPFVMLAGTYFSREYVNEYYEFDKHNEVYVSLTAQKKHFPKLKRRTNLDNLDHNATEVVLAISLTKQIDSVDTEQFQLPIVHLSVDKPGDNVITSKVQLREYRQTVYDTIMEIQNKLLHVTKMHLLYSGQSCLAFEMGKFFNELDSNRISEVISYQYSRQLQPRYHWSLNINGQQKGLFTDLRIQTGGEVNI